MDIVFTSASKLSQMLRQREISAVEILESYLKQIDRYNSKINAVITLNAERAMQQAKAADEALAQGENWGILHGIPMTIKDTLATMGLKTTAGYPPLKDYFPSEDATTVARLKAAGAIILGKTNSAKLAGDYQTCNPLFGLTKNPWNTDYTVGGSSGGSASAIAAGFSALDIGSDVAGSIRQPAHCCGVYGFMATDRRVPTTGHIPELPGNPQHIRRLLRIGPFARSVEDLRLCLTLIAGADSKQPEIPPVALDKPTNKKLTTLKIAWTYGYDFLPLSQDTHNAIKNLINRLSDAGCHLEECQPQDFDWEEALANYSVCAGYELFISASELGILSGMWTGIVTEFYARTQTAFKSGTPLTKKGNLIFPPSMAKYNRILTQRDRQISQMERFLDRWDVWICPIAITPAFPHCDFGKPIEVDGIKFPYLLACGGYTMPFSLLGNPVVVIPIGKSKTGLPIGVQVVGKRWQDMDLLAVAQEITQVLDSFQSPCLESLGQ